MTTTMKRKTVRKPSNRPARIAATRTAAKITPTSHSKSHKVRAATFCPPIFIGYSMSLESRLGPLVSSVTQDFSANQKAPPQVPGPFVGV